jgi:hypothetical protein
LVKRGLQAARARGVELGRKSNAEKRPEVVALAKSLGRKRKRPLSLRAISAELAARGVLNERGRPFHPKSIASMLA